MLLTLQHRLLTHAPTWLLGALLIALASWDDSCRYAKPNW